MYMLNSAVSHKRHWNYGQFVQVSPAFILETVCIRCSAHDSSFSCLPQFSIQVSAGSAPTPQQQQNNTFIVNTQQRPQLGPALGHQPPRQPTPPPALSEDDKRFLSKPVRRLLALHDHLVSIIRLSSLDIVYLFHRFSRTWFKHATQAGC